MLLSAYNYKLMALGVLFVLIGFGGMYIEGQQYGFFALYAAPVLVMAGFALVAVGVFRTDPELRRREENHDHPKADTPGSPSQ